MKPKVANPYGKLNVETCYLDEDDKIPAPDVLYYPGIPASMPRPDMGSYEELGMAPDTCWERLGRFGSYGFTYKKDEGGFDLEQITPADKATQDLIQKIDYRGINWGKVQSRCLEKNRRRHSPKDRPSRQAFILRAWTGLEFTPMRIITIRALITELSLKTGGLYDVHLLMHVRDDDLPVHTDEKVYQDTLRANVPEEFRDMTTLWSVPHMAATYPGLREEDTIENDSRKPLYSVYRIPHFALQWFAQRHPEYEHFWNWEIDVRYTGHYFEFFDSAAAWAQRQPRKHLWERNTRWWIPALHGTWEAFAAMVAGEAAASGEPSPWGPVRVSSSSAGDGHPAVPSPPGTSPPGPPAGDGYRWGVGEAADLVTFNPLFDPERHAWCLRLDVTGYNRSEAPPPRRTSIITVGRFSRRLLAAMHDEARAGHHMFPEMAAGSVALHHGLKAVYVPHPVYHDRRWPPAKLDRVFNRPAAPQDSVFYFPFVEGTGEQNFLTSSFYYKTDFGPALWHNWLAQRDGGSWDEAVERDTGRMCLRGTLIHPVKSDFASDVPIGGT